MAIEKWYFSKFLVKILTPKFRGIRWRNELILIYWCICRVRYNLKLTIIRKTWNNLKHVEILRIIEILVFLKTLNTCLKLTEKLNQYLN